MSELRYLSMVLPPEGLRDYGKASRSAALAVRRGAV